jgi:hypothetical protein
VPVKQSECFIPHSSEPCTLPSPTRKPDVCNEQNNTLFSCTVCEEEETLIDVMCVGLKQELVRSLFFGHYKNVVLGYSIMLNNKQQKYQICMCTLTL